MTNGEKFQLIFGFHPYKLRNNDDSFLKWLDTKYTPLHDMALLTCSNCKLNFVAKPYRYEKDEFDVITYYYKCTYCNADNTKDYCYWR